MRQEIDDIELGKKLKAAFPESGENQWFTSKVLNRLPEKEKSYRWVENVAYAIGSVLCVICWAVFISVQKFDVVTVRDVVNILIMAGVTGTVFVQAIRSAFAPARDNF